MVKMSIPARMEAVLGEAALYLIRWALRRRLAVRVREHRDARGRVTPWLELGDSTATSTLVWIHGFSDRPDGFLRTADALAPGVRIVAPAVPAFHEGWQDADETHTIAAYADWLAPVVEAAAPEGPYVLVGNSLGGAIVLELAARRPLRLRAVVAVNAAGLEVDGFASVADEFRNQQSPFEIRKREQVDELFSRILGRSIRLPFPFGAALFREYASYADWYVRLGEDIGQSEVRLKGDGWRAVVDLHAVDAPALVLWGDRDTLFPKCHAERMAAELPKGRLQWLDGIGHSPHMERPKALARALRQFLDSLD